MADHERIDLDGEDEAILDRIADRRPQRDGEYRRRIRSMSREATKMFADDRRELERTQAIEASRRMAREPEREETPSDPND